MKILFTPIRYLILTGWIFVAFYLGDYLFAITTVKPLGMFAYFFAVIWGGDILIKNTLEKYGYQE